jgi:hypothetical protein
VKKKIKEIFGDSEYQKVLVVLEVDKLPLIKKAQKSYGINIWFIDDIIERIIRGGATTGSRDDVLRTLELVSILQGDEDDYLRRERKMPIIDLHVKVDKRLNYAGKSDYGNTRKTEILKGLASGWNKINKQDKEQT